jgi:hypothetical protein
MNLLLLHHLIKEFPLLFFAVLIVSSVSSVRVCFGVRVRVSSCCVRWGRQPGVQTEGVEGLRARVMLRDRGFRDYYAPFVCMRVLINLKL